MIGNPLRPLAIVQSSAKFQADRGEKLRVLSRSDVMRKLKLCGGEKCAGTENILIFSEHRTPADS